MSQATQQRRPPRRQREEAPWIPKTILGKRVASGEITTLEEILENSLRIQEAGIIKKLFSRKNIPAAYLTGYLAGKKALGKGAKNAILYSGTRKYTQRMAAALKGVVDSGLEIPADPETFPPEERIKGEHLSVKNDVLQLKSAIDSEVKTA